LTEERVKGVVFSGTKAGQEVGVGHVGGERRAGTRRERRVRRAADILMPEVGFHSPAVFSRYV
jgi:hypothetical protein